MTLSVLLSAIGVTMFPSPDVTILSVTEHADCATAGSLFVCVRGSNADGHRFAPTAYRGGCRFFVAEQPLPLPGDAQVFPVPDTRLALAKLACTFYGNPSREMTLIGITGTKGKTTTAQLLSHILNRSGVPCGYIGTNGVSFGSVREETENTTPDAVTLQRLLQRMLHAGFRTAVLEVSSQAIRQNRVAGIRFDTCIFTNLYPDHIGPAEHPDFADYRACKHRLFTDYGAQTVIFNLDDPEGSGMVGDSPAKERISCSISGSSDFLATGISCTRDADALGVAFTVRSATGGSSFCTLPLTGKVNAANALLAIAAANRRFGIPLRKCAALLGDARVAGRSELFRLPNGAYAVIDYAHNGESLRQLLLTLREYRPTRLLCLFGSVGGRTGLRRYEMGKAAAELADFSFLTSDNPGTEEPSAIIRDIAAAFAETGAHFLAIPDREAAIREAVQSTVAGDILLLAGKGQETYQLIGTEKRPFSERKILEDAVLYLSSAGM